ncbi:MAG: DUF952 domain-containing protein [Balneolaceae bacterium]
MEIDLLFTAVKDSDWKKVTETGDLIPDTFSEYGHIKCFEGKDAEEIINQDFEDSSAVLLLVIDPLRIQSPIKRIIEGDFSYIAVQGTFSVDVIIDKIKLEQNKKGRFAIKVKHFE